VVPDYLCGNYRGDPDTKVETRPSFPW